MRCGSFFLGGGWEVPEQRERGLRATAWRAQGREHVELLGPEAEGAGGYGPEVNAWTFISRMGHG